MIHKVQLRMAFLVSSNTALVSGWPASLQARETGWELGEVGQEHCMQERKVWKRTIVSVSLVKRRLGARVSPNYSFLETVSSQM